MYVPLSGQWLRVVSVFAVSGVSVLALCLLWDAIIALTDAQPRLKGAQLQPRKPSKLDTPSPHHQNIAIYTRHNIHSHEACIR
jgi:hypothetical protein